MRALTSEEQAAVDAIVKEAKTLTDEALGDLIKRLDEIANERELDIYDVPPAPIRG